MARQCEASRLEERKHPLEDGEDEDEQDKSEEESEENTKSKATTTELADVREVVTNK